MDSRECIHVAGGILNRLDEFYALTAKRAKVAKLEAEVKIAEAKGWRDAVTCVQYCNANWSQDCRSEAERKALEDASEELVLELVTCSPGEWLGSEWKTAQDYGDIITKLEAENAALFKQANDMSWQVDQSGQMMEKLEAEVERLNKALTYEQHRAGRQGTHWPGCHTGGPEHYECLKADTARRREVGIGVAASLAAAISLLERGGKRVAPSDKMFAVMLDDYRAALTAYRAAMESDQ
jgi:hypothetical protein